MKIIIKVTLVMQYDTPNFKYLLKNKILAIEPYREPALWKIV